MTAPGPIRVRDAVAGAVQFEQGGPDVEVGNRVAVLAHWSPGEVVNPSTRAMVTQLADQGYRVVVSSASPARVRLDWGDVDSDDLVVLRKPNIGYDFGSWSVALERLPTIADAEHVLFANDSLIGPFASIGPLLHAFETSEADAWGATASTELGLHLQSYFFGMSGEVLRRPEIQRFWDQVAVHPTKDAVVEHYELGLSRLLLDGGGTIDAWFELDRERYGDVNPTLQGWRRLLYRGFPFVKRALLEWFSGAPDREELRAAVLARFGADLDEWTHEPVERHRAEPVRVVASRPPVGPPSTGTATVLEANGGTLDFMHWVTRHRHRLDGTPTHWQGRADLRIDTPARVAVLVHVYYADLLDELLQQLESIPVPFDLVITDAAELPLRQIEPPGACRSVRVFVVENRGRDMLPLAHVVNAGVLDQYELVLKIHTKRSEWRRYHELGGAGEGWRNSLLGDLLGSPANVAAILDAFASRPELGVVTGTGSVLGPDWWGDNQLAVAHLLRRIEMDVREPDLRFAAGSMYWVRGFVLQGLRSLALSRDDFEPEAGAEDSTAAHALERALGLLTREAGLEIEERRRLPSEGTGAGTAFYHPDHERVPRASVVPFYLPQFHPFPENDRWWGQGFTEWTNVSGAQPLFPGHVQPKLPSDLGFYDLRLDEVRERQAELSKHAGLAGFMYYHYWFAGQRVMGAPLDRLLASDLDQPFCLMWANENWTRTWDGLNDQVLVAQEFESVPPDAFIEDILPALADRRYMTVDGRRILAVYRPALFPDVRGTTDRWRERVREEGLGELYLLAVDSGELAETCPGLDVWGFDGALGFPPHRHRWVEVGPWSVGADARFEGALYSYEEMRNAAERDLEAARAGDRLHPGVMVGFDNTARRAVNPDIWYGANPYAFRRWLAAAVAAVQHRPPGERLVFVNAWNEWAESAVLEPSQRHGHGYLGAVRDVVLAGEKAPVDPPPGEVAPRAEDAQLSTK
ncbi:MAG: glycoside hydrolase family 99-like domain-containing protein [Actinomycetota bacterium]|nr:glycoside hydrolase family 99-like domain-containing protein [Actinomycetota bacterium]